MGASIGRPYCMNGQIYLKSDRHLSKTCRECEHIRYIGCPGFKAITRNPYDTKTRWWIDWWYHGKPIPKDYHKIIDSRSLRPSTDNSMNKEDSNVQKAGNYRVEEATKKNLKKKGTPPPSPEPCNSSRTTGDPRGRGGI